jgi:hypothetical protein
MSKGAAMIDAWVDQMEQAQPEYGPLLISTTEKVGVLPAIDDDGSIKSISDGIKFWAASGFAQSFTAQSVENRRIELLGSEYPELEAAGDEDGMILAQQKAEFYETLQEWIEDTEPQQRCIAEVPAWLAPFLSAVD